MGGKETHVYLIFDKDPQLTKNVYLETRKTTMTALKNMAHLEEKKSADEPVYSSKFRGSMTAKKTDWTSTYTHPTPELYIEALGPLDYGHYQDQLNRVLHPVMKAFCADEEKDYNQKVFRAVEFGALYGNTTLAYKYGLDWKGCCNIWTHDEAPLVPKHNIHVTGSDISSPALNYGLSRRIYNEIFVQDFNNRLDPKLYTSLSDADMLFILMSTNYLQELAFQRMLLTFLDDRSKPKLLCYNVVCAFDNRNLSPEALFSPIVDEYDCETKFIKHRNFSPEESECRDGCKESWTLTYVVRFNSKVTSLEH